jgi:predicted O-methyltransferase YrrM
LYSSFQLAKKYFHYYLHASNGKGYGVHSPFVFDFIKQVLNDKKKYDCYEAIETARQSLLNNNAVIEVEDFGAGSAVIKSNKRVVKKMASSSLKPKKYAQLLYRMVRYYQPGTIVELGTSFGITTSYLASGNPHAKVYTLEGASTIAGLAQTHFNNLHLKNIQLLTGRFDQSIPLVFSVLQKIDLAFIDGNHQKEPTLDYFNKILSLSAPSSIIILDDIHWSNGMEEAWEQIKQHPAVTLTIDLFFIGIVCFNHDIKVKQHFSLRF